MKDDKMVKMREKRAIMAKNRYHMAFFWKC
jgi:hypothetical protein